jgi:NAD(P)-dependent dehydrogenase (short-subunit alcohol dehydrogenase family)
MTALQGRVALVTGASRGIGRACALDLARAGAAVVASARDDVALADLVTQITSAGGDASAMSCDVTDAAQVEHLVDHVIEHHARLDILVNAAQSAQIDVPLEALDPADLTVAIASGIFGTFHLMRAAMPHLRAAGNGSIVNFGDPDAVVGEPGKAATSVAKEGVRALSRTAAREWGRYGIRVNVVNPMALSERVRADLERAPDLEPWLAAQIPGGRVGEPDDVARVVTFLASDDSEMLTGATVEVDGGRNMYA